VALGLSGLTVLLTWPMARGLGRLAANLGDPLLTTWTLAWDLHALATAPLRLFDANMFHPHRWTLAYTEHLLGLVPLAWPAHLLGASPLLAHNLVWLGTFPLVGLAMFWLVRELAGHGGAAAVAAVLYAFSHFRFGQLGHVQILSHAWLPIALLGLHRGLTRGARWRDAWLTAGAAGLQALSSGYHAFLVAVAMAVFAFWAAAPAARPPLGRLTARGVLAGATVLLLLLPTALPYAFVREDVGLVRDLAEVSRYAARPESYLAAPAGNRWLGELTAGFRRPEGILFPGVVTLALAVPAAVLAGRRRPNPPARGRWPRALDLALVAFGGLTTANWLLLGGFVLRVGPVRLSQRHFAVPFAVLALTLAARRLVHGRAQPLYGLGWLRRLGWPNAAGYYVVLTVVAAIASLGPSLPLGEGRVAEPLYRRLYDLVPGFDALRVPGRFGVLVTTGLVVLAGLGAAALARRIAGARSRAAVLAGLAALGALEAWAVPLRLVEVPAASPADQWLAAQPGRDAVAVLPMYGASGAHFESLRLVAATVHWRPLVNGYAGVFPSEYPDTVTVLNTFPAPAAVARLRAMHVRYVVVHLAPRPGAAEARLAALMADLPPGVTRVARFPLTAVFEVGAETPRP
jgi:hypothetical protein